MQHCALTVSAATQSQLPLDCFHGPNVRFTPFSLSSAVAHVHARVLPLRCLVEPLVEVYRKLQNMHLHILIFLQVTLSVPAIPIASQRLACRYSSCCGRIILFLDLSHTLLQGCSGWASCRIWRCHHPPILHQRPCVVACFATPPSDLFIAIRPSS